MRDDTPMAPGYPRLNLFAFSSTTDMRFALLIIAVLGTSLFIFGVLNDLFQYSQFLASFDCTIQHVGNPSSLLDAIAVIEQCRAPYLAQKVARELGGVVLLLLVATLLYWIFPILKLKRGRMEPLRQQDAPEVVAALRYFCYEAGLVRPPLFVWNPLNLTSSALAFGRPGRYYVALSGGLVTKFYTDPPAFHAIVLHELAHLHNADVNKTYFAVAVWWAFILVAFVPFALSMLVQAVMFPHDPDQMLFAVLTIGFILLLTMIVYLIRNAVLRSREFYADVRASLWLGSSQELIRVLLTLPSASGTFRSVMRVHPEPSDRYQMLAESFQLLSLNAWEVFGVGIAVGIALPGIQDLFAYFFTSLLPLLGAESVIPLEMSCTALIAALLMIGTVGLGVWRMTFATLVGDQVAYRTGQYGLVVGLGLILGTFLNVSSGTSILLYTQPASVFVASLPWMILLLISFVLFFRWVAASAAIWLRVAVTKTSPRPVLIAGLAVACVVLTVLLATLLPLRLISNVSGTFAPFEGLILIPLYMIEVVPQQLPVVLALISLWAFPLAVWFWRGQQTTASTASWAFLDPSPHLSIQLRQDSFHLLLALKIAVLAGLAFCGLLLATRIVLKSAVSNTMYNSDDYLLFLAYSQIAVAALVQAAITGIVAFRVRQVGSFYGLFAGFICSCVTTVGILGINWFFSESRVIPLYVSWITFSFVVSWGTFLVLLVGAGISLLRLGRDRFIASERGRSTIVRTP